jgi:tRNA-binding protein
MGDFREIYKQKEDNPPSSTGPTYSGRSTGIISKRSWGSYDSLWNKGGIGIKIMPPRAFLYGYSVKRRKMSQIDWKDFQKVELRVGTIVDVQDFPEARSPAYKLQVDFGQEVGIKKSSAQITDLYTKDDLLGKQVVAVVNFPPKQIGPVMSECLVTGFHREDGAVVLAIPDMNLHNGARLA